jgi:tetratricopeptide (TPR) repeat protein
MPVDRQAKGSAMSARKISRRQHDAQRAQPGTIPPAAPPPSLNDLVAAAFHLHQTNQPEAAEDLYRRILAAPSPHADANYGLGVLCHTQGRIAEAAEAWRRTLAIRGEDVDTMSNLGTALLTLGQHTEAIAWLRRAIALRPTFALAHANLGKALQDCGQLVDAIAAYRHAVMLDAGNVTALANLSSALIEQQHYEDAAAAASQAIAVQPEMALAHANFAVAMFRLGRYDDALAASRTAIALQPPMAMMYATLGGVLVEVGAFTEAVAACRQAIALDPRIAMAYLNLAHAHKAMNQLVEAEAACRQAVTLLPDSADYHFLLGHLLLVQGDFDRGWQEYEWRWKLPNFAWLRDFQAEFTQPQWHGEDLTGKTILILTEQGLGDIILFARYAPMLTARGAQVVVATMPNSHRLLSSLVGVRVVSLIERPLPGFDFYCPLLNLPRLMGGPANSLPTTLPYLHAEPAKRAEWQARLPATRPRVGIVWGGNPVTMYDRFRSPRLERMRPLLNVPGITFVALQVGPAREDLQRSPLPPHVIDLGPDLDDLSTTAAIMSELDLVISSCTAPLHLAGALGVPTWGVIPYAPYFTWLLNRADTPWYPSVHLYRQDVPGLEWSNLIGQVAQDLQAFAQNYQTRLQP